MKEIIKQLINQIEEDQNLSVNTKVSYKSDLNDLLDYVASTNSELANINQEWVRNYLKHLESTNKERNSYNRRASTFRIFLRFLYKSNLAPTNYALIVDNQTTFFKTQEYKLPAEDIKKIIDNTKLKIDERLILQMVGKLGLTGTQITSLNTFQVDFENKAINLSDTEIISLPHEVFITLREYLIEVRSTISGSSNHLSLFLNDKGEPVTESDIYKLIKTLSEELSLQGKLTTRSLKNLFENKNDILSMQKEILDMVGGTGV